MLRRSDIVELVTLSAFVVALGCGLCFLTFSFLPLWFAVGLVGCFLLMFTVGAGLRRCSSAVQYGAVGLTYTVTFVWAVSTYTGVTRFEQHECDWKLVDGLIEVELGDGFGSERIKSPQLGTYLKEQYPAKVQVILPITRDFGKVRSRG